MEDLLKKWMDLTMTDQVLNQDDPNRPGNLSVEEYNRELAEYASAHPKSVLDPSLYTEYEDDE